MACDCDGYDTELVKGDVCVFEIGTVGVIAVVGSSGENVDSVVRYDACDVERGIELVEGSLSTAVDHVERVCGSPVSAEASDEDFVGLNDVPPVERCVDAISEIGSNCEEVSEGFDD